MNSKRKKFGLEEDPSTDGGLRNSAVLGTATFMNSKRKKDRASEQKRSGRPEIGCYRSGMTEWRDRIANPCGFDIRIVYVRICEGYSPRLNPVHLQQRV
jgi:hypothetical protein